MEITRVEQGLRAIFAVTICWPTFIRHTGVLKWIEISVELIDNNFFTLYNIV